MPCTRLGTNGKTYLLEWGPIPRSIWRDTISLSDVKSVDRFRIVTTKVDMVGDGQDRTKNRI